MIALSSLLLAFLAGWYMVRRLVAQPEQLISIFGLPAATAAALGPWFSAASALIVGLQVTTIAVYVLAVLAQLILPTGIYPLLPANLIVSLFIICLLYRDWRINSAVLPAKRWTGWHLTADQFQSQRLFFIACACFCIYGSWLAFYTFSQTGAFVSAGYSVFSDFAPHTALVSSFAKGRNFPAGYPHFAGDGIAYHFLFYFLCGNLHYLGLPISWAINLPSVLTLVAFCVLLGILAVAVTRERVSFLLAPFLMFFRSSFAFLTRLRDLWQQPDARFATVLREILTAREYIGDTPNDSWGLWGLNVYANQRHLLFGFSAMIMVLLLFLPFVRPVSRLSPSMPSAESTSNLSRIRYDWLVPVRDRPKVFLALIISVLLPYFHGSALIGLLAVLCGLALFSRARLAHAAVCLAAVLSAVVQGRLFRSGGSFIAPRLLFGFILEDRSFAGIIAYLFEMSGLVLPLALITAILIPVNRRLLFAFSLPLVFGLTVALTPDVTVNHKYLIMTFALCGCLVAGLLIRLWKRKSRLRILRRGLAIILLITLTATGMMELIVFRNLNMFKLTARTDSPMSVFVENNTPPQSVFVTGPLHYHALLMTGRQIYFGHAYYAWSAGHDTFERERQVRWFLAAADEDLAAIDSFVRSEGVDYLMIDDELRRHPEFSVNEAFFRENYLTVASIPETANLVILDLHQRIGDSSPAIG